VNQSRKRIKKNALWGHDRQNDQATHRYSGNDADEAAHAGMIAEVGIPDYYGEWWICVLPIGHLELACYQSTPW